MKLVQNPVRPAATIPALMAPMMKRPTKVPKIVPVPPNTEVPPRNTEARVLSRYPLAQGGPVELHGRAHHEARKGGHEHPRCRR